MNAILIVPTNMMGDISGVRAISIGARKVRAQLFSACYSFKRSALPKVLPDDYMELANLIRPIARDIGIECGNIV